MRSITAKVNNRVLTFSTNDGLHWFVSAISPDVTGVYPVELTLTEDNGVTLTLTVDDPVFRDFLRLYVSTRNSKLIRFLPEFLRDVEEFKALFAAEDFEIDFLYPAIESIFAEKLIMGCSDKRLNQWEQMLNITPQGTLEERRHYVKAVLSGTGKLNESKIKNIVKALTEGDSNVSFHDSAIYVKVLPPGDGTDFRFSDIERALLPLIPAHLGLTVERYYSTWGDVKMNYTDWGTVKEKSDWNTVKNWIAP